MNNIQPSDPSGLLEVLREAERARQASEKSPILREDVASVRINIWPELIPRASVDPHQLNLALDREFGSKLDRARLVDAIPDEVRGGLEPSRLLAHALTQDRLIPFIGGTLKIPDARRVTQIRTLWFSEQNLSAEVAGSTAEAEYCVRQLAILLSKAAGIERVWSDFEPHVENTSYVTSTVVDLGTNFTRMLAPSIRHFLAVEVSGSGDFGVQMSGMGSIPGKVGINHRDGGPLVFAPGLKRVELVVTSFDRESGYTDNATIEFVAHTTSDINRSRVKVVTELPSADHKRFVEKLIVALDKAG